MGRHLPTGGEGAHGEVPILSRDILRHKQREWLIYYLATLIILIYIGLLLFCSIERAGLLQSLSLGLLC